MARQSTLARFEVSGEILGEDVVGQLTAKECRLAGGQRAEKDFSTAWDLLSEEWQMHRHHLADYGTERLRRRWISPFLETLGYDLRHQKAHFQFGDKETIPITYRTDGGVPIWVLDYGQSPDDKIVTGRRSRSPHEIFQDYLDQDDTVNWGILCNGKTIRLLHDYHKTLTRNYVEADLESIFDSLDVDAFRAVWRIFHADGFLPSDKGARPIEQLRDYSRQEGAEIGKELRLQVLEALKILGNGFLAADPSGYLLTCLREDKVNGPMEFYQALLRVVYRLLFLLYIENREGWMPAADSIWASSYSITRLREQAEQETSSRAGGEDHWEGLKVVFGIIRNGYIPKEGDKPFVIRPYGGELFNDDRLWELADKPLRNADLLAAIHHLTTFERNKQPYRVNFRALRIEALGSVYEGLLDVAPVITNDGVFDFAEGTERKLSGSYYTPSSLVEELIKSALIPVIEEKLQGFTTKEESERALLSLRVIDPACGSGHFLLAATDALAAYLCNIRLGGEEPSDLDVREARRSVVEKCIFGVDLRPMAVELCKFGLWLHVAHPNFPLSYLEPHILWGNSLVGVPLLRQVEAATEKVNAEQQRLRDAGEARKAERSKYVGWPTAIPGDAYDPVAGDDKAAAKRVKSSNDAFAATGQLTLGVEADSVVTLRKRASLSHSRVMMAGERTDDEVHRKDFLWKEHRAGKDYSEPKLLADLWCAAFYWRLVKDADADVPTTENLRRVGRDGIGGVNKEELSQAMSEELQRIVDVVRPFHWELEFPEVFEAGGFDCVLGNPPWERIKLQEQEFFASRAPQISKAQNKAARQKMIDTLELENPALLGAFQYAKHAAEAESKFIRKAGRFPLTAIGDVNTYALFAEHFRTLLSSIGRAGVIVPTGIATDDTTKTFFGDLVVTRSLESYFGFKNERFLFQKPVEHTVTFGLLTMLGSGVQADQMEFCWLAYTVEEKQDASRRIVLNSEDIALVNPNTRTCPVFRTRADAELTRAIYERVPVLWQEEGNLNPWGVRFMAMIHMSNDSGLFTPPHKDPVPLYEAKMLHQFDHRFATYERGARTGGDDVETRPVTEAEKRNPSFGLNPRYFVERDEVWKKVARIPELLIDYTLAGSVKEVSQILQMWFTGYNLNRGDEGDAYRAKMGEQTLQKMSATAFGSMEGDVMAYLTNQSRLRALEQRFPLDDGDITVVSAFAEAALARGGTEDPVDVLDLAKELIARKCPKWLLGWRDIARNTDIRTVISAVLPLVAVGDKYLLAFLSRDDRENICFFANLNSLILDYTARQKIGGTSVKYFTFKQFPVLPPAVYGEADIAYIAPRIVELVYTSHDMKPFAEDMNYHGKPFVWDEDRRALLRAELDAYFARLYGLTRKQLRYILDPHGLSDTELTDILDPTEDPTCAGPHLLPAEPTVTFPGETFRVLKNSDTAKYGDYRTRRLVLEAWAQLEEDLGPAPVRNYHELVNLNVSPVRNESNIMRRSSNVNAKASASSRISVTQAEPKDLTLVHPNVISKINQKAS